MQISREEILKVYEAGPEAVVLLVQELCSRITKLEQTVASLDAKVKELEARLAKDSHNSHKPPSSDGPKKPLRTKSLRQKSDNPSGGQKGHAPHQLSQVDNPDKIEVKRVLNCEHCQRDISAQKPKKVKKLQAFDIPPLRIGVTEYQAEVKDCMGCGKENHAELPEGITQPVQYGPNLKALAVYMMNGHFMPYERTSQFFSEVFGHTLSQGSLYNFQNRFYGLLSSVEHRIKKDILNSPVAHFDETGINIAGVLHWLHSASSKELTYYAVHKKRGSQAMDAIGILKEFLGRAVHDRWKCYFNYPCVHSLCNAHILRDLTFVEEQKQEAWAGKMKKCIKAMKESMDYYKEKGKTLSTKLKIYYENRYDRIIRQGLALHKSAKLKSLPQKRGRKAQSPGKNLLDNLKEYKNDILAFLYDPNVPFDNNQAERDVRMAKLKEKISGCYRSTKGAEFFCRIRGFISTARKKGLPVLQSIQQVFIQQASF